MPYSLCLMLFKACQLPFGNRRHRRLFPGKVSVELFLLLTAILVGFLVVYAAIGWSDAPIAEVVFDAPMVLDDLSFNGDGLASFACTILSLSSSSLEVLGSQTSCGCFWTDDVPFSLGAGQKKVLRFWFDRAKRRNTPADIQFDMTVKFLINGVEGPLVKSVAFLPKVDLMGRSTVEPKSAGEMPVETIGAQ